MPGALPEEAALNPTRSRLAWKQERAGISPRRSLLKRKYVDKEIKNIINIVLIFLNKKEISILKLI